MAERVNHWFNVKTLSLEIHSHGLVIQHEVWEKAWKREEHECSTSGGKALVPIVLQGECG